MNPNEHSEKKFADFDASVQGAVTPDLSAFDALVEKLRSAVTFTYESGGDGYQKSADAMSVAAIAAFEWAAGAVGATGFQASYAALEFYAKVMHVDGPFMILKVEDALYPQYDIEARVREFIAEQGEWLREQAIEKIATSNADFVHPDVLEHWRKLAGSS